MKIIIKAAFALFLGIVAANEDEPSYKIVENFVLESPISQKEIDNWVTYKTSVMT